MPDLSRRTERCRECGYEGPRDGFEGWEGPPPLLFVARCPKCEVVHPDQTNTPIPADDPPGALRLQGEAPMNELQERAEEINYQFQKARADKATAEVDALREAVALHARILDGRAVGRDTRDRDDIDNDLYNAARELDPEWWDEQVPGLARVTR